MADVVFTEPIDIDADVRNADWIKMAFDLSGVESVEDLRAYLEIADLSVEEFKALPAYTLALASGEYPWLGSL